MPSSNSESIDMNHTTLTPQFSMLGGGTRSKAATQTSSKVKGIPVESLRAMVHDALSKNLHSTASFLAERLMRTSCTLSDIVLFARCYLTGGEPRRCLAVLEQKGLLSATHLRNLSDSLQPSTQATSTSSSSSASSSHQTLGIQLYAVLLASQCLLQLEQLDDCITLLEPLVIIDEQVGSAEAINSARRLGAHGKNSGNNCEINTMAAVYCTAAKCWDALDNRPRAVFALLAAIRIDPACVEAVEYLCANGMMSAHDKVALYSECMCAGIEESSNCDKDGSDQINRDWLQGYYRFMLLDESPEECKPEGLVMEEADGVSGGDLVAGPSAIWLVHRAEQLYERQCPEDAYRLARQAYTMDPFDWRGLLVYIAAMVDLGLKTELFYLGHELAHTYPKSAVSWYAVGCYYWCCRRLEMCQKYLMKATKIDKRFAKAWVILGHALAALEESEHAVSAFRTAARLLPSDHRPLIYMAKELVRTNSLPLALRLLQSALEIAPHDANVLNELGVVYMRLDRKDEAISTLFTAVQIVQEMVGSGTGTGGWGGGSIQPRPKGTQSSFRKGWGEEILNNYATALRRGGRIQESIYWYQLCLAANPVSAGTHANLAFAYHLLQNFDEAITCYHRALALQPTYTFCSEMLSRALKDSNTYQFIHSNASSPVRLQLSPLGVPHHGDITSPNLHFQQQHNTSDFSVSHLQDGGLGDLSISVDEPF